MSTLNHLQSLSGHHLIGGSLRAGRGTVSIPVIDPATERVIGAVTEALSLIHI